MEYPQIKKLYKYYAYNEHSLKVLSNRQIWLADPRSFNDPFDCALNIKRTLSDDDCLRIFEENVREALSSPDLDNTGRLECKKLLERIKKDKSFRDETVRAFRIRIEVPIATVEMLGAFCMSELPDNLLMWAHYTRSHTGFCIEFSREPDNLLGSFGHTRPVSYTYYYPDISDIDLLAPRDHEASDPIRPVTSAMYWTKSADWAYEKEWRLVTAGLKSLLDLPGEISGVIFGINMPQEHRDKI